MESLDFKVTLSGTYWDKKPKFSIQVNEEVTAEGEITEDSDQPQEVAFSVSDLQDGNHQLIIKLENKTADDHVIKDGKDLDMLLNIRDIEIDGISVEHLKWESKFIPNEPQEYQGKTITELPACVNLGWNGRYVFEFSTPFYLWLLEKL